MEQARAVSIRAAVGGAVAAAVSLASSELVAGLASAVPSLVESVGTVVIDNVPAAVKDWAIDVFGTSDKLALVVGITVVSLILGAAVGVVGRHRFWVAIVVFGGFGVAGALAAIGVGEAPGGAAVGGTVAAIAGLLSLAWLFTRIDKDVATREHVPDAVRRAFIGSAGALVAVAALSAGAGRALMARTRLTVAGRDEIVLPGAGEVASSPPPAASFEVPDLTPLVTPNQDFYRIDTALSTPQVDLAEWTLRIHGMVDRPLELAFEDLLEMDMVERYVTLTCVSNQVGGGLIGNAKWLGVPLSDLLARARVQDGADQLIGRSVDDFTVGFPTEAAFDGRDALVAVGMNDEPLPFDHGFPARLVVAGLYGYVSATKWLSDIELTTWDAFDAYWVPRGWSKEGPIKTQSRIDTPRQGATIRAGERAIAGVAWAPNLGIERVEVQVDDADWIDAELAEPLDADTWRQWMLPWDADVGEHEIRVRATDASGYTQTPDLAPPAPDGATGWHTIRVAVEA